MLPWRRNSGKNEGPEEAPYLSHKTKHHGVYTLTAADNMGRKKEEERRKPRKKRPVDPDIVDAVRNVGRDELAGPVPRAGDSENPLGVPTVTLNYPKGMTQATQAMLSGKSRPGNSRKGSSYSSSLGEETEGSSRGKAGVKGVQIGLQKVQTNSPTPQGSPQGTGETLGANNGEKNLTGGDDQDTASMPSSAIGLQGDSLSPSSAVSAPFFSGSHDLGSSLNSGSLPGQNGGPLGASKGLTPPQTGGGLSGGSKAPHASRDGSSSALNASRGLPPASSLNTGKKAALSTNEPSVISRAARKKLSEKNATEKAKSSGKKDAKGKKKNKKKGENEGLSVSPAGNATQRPPSSQSRDSSTLAHPESVRGGSEDTRRVSVPPSVSALSTRTDTTDLLGLSLESLPPPPAYEPPSPATRARMAIPYEFGDRMSVGTRSRGVSNASMILPPPVLQQSSISQILGGTRNGRDGEGHIEPISVNGRVIERSRRGGVLPEDDATVPGELSSARVPSTVSSPVIPNFPDNEERYIQAWEEDRAAGYSLDERIERDLSRRMAGVALPEGEDEGVGEDEGEETNTEDLAEQDTQDRLAQRRELALAEASSDATRLARVLSVYGERRLARRVSVLGPRRRTLRAPGWVAGSSSRFSTLAGEISSLAEGGQDSEEEEEKEEEGEKEDRKKTEESPEEEAQRRFVSRQKIIEAAERRLNAGGAEAALNSEKGGEKGQPGAPDTSFERPSGALDTSLESQNKIPKELPPPTRDSPTPHATTSVARHSDPFSRPSQRGIPTHLTTRPQPAFTGTVPKSLPHSPAMSSLASFSKSGAAPSLLERESAGPSALGGGDRIIRPRGGPTGESEAPEREGRRHSQSLAVSPPPVLAYRDPTSPSSSALSSTTLYPLRSLKPPPRPPRPPGLDYTPAERDIDSDTAEETQNVAVHRPLPVPPAGEPPVGGHAGSITNPLGESGYGGPGAFGGGGVPSLASSPHLMTGLTRSNSLILQGAGLESRQRRRRGSGMSSSGSSPVASPVASPLRQNVVQPRWVSEERERALAMAAMTRASVPEERAAPPLAPAAAVQIWDGALEEEEGEEEKGNERGGRRKKEGSQRRRGSGSARLARVGSRGGTMGGFSNTQGTMSGLRQPSTSTNSGIPATNVPATTTSSNPTSPPLLETTTSTSDPLTSSPQARSLTREELAAEIQSQLENRTASLGDNTGQSRPQYTELDLLVARLNDPETRAEANYEDYLLLSEILGGGGRTPGLTTEELGELSEGLVEIVHRRVDSQGRTKLKLEVVGVRCVECRICLARFRARDRAIVLPRCLHVFHSECLQTWLRQRRSCPLCRKAVFEGDHRVNETTGRTESDY